MKKFIIAAVIIGIFGVGIGYGETSKLLKPNSPPGIFKWLHQTTHPTSKPKEQQKEVQEVTMSYGHPVSSKKQKNSQLNEQSKALTEKVLTDH